MMMKNLLSLGLAGTAAILLVVGGVAVAQNTPSSPAVSAPTEAPASAPTQSMPSVPAVPSVPTMPTAPVESGASAMDANRPSMTTDATLPARADRN